MRTVNLNRKYLLALCLAASTSAVTRAQTQSIAQATRSVEHAADQAPLCHPDLIDTMFTFSNLPLPVGWQTISLHFQNKGDVTCRLHGWAGPSFAADGHSVHVQTCWLCDQGGGPPRDPEREPGNQMVLAPGQRASLDLGWASTGETCQWADWVSFSVGWARNYGYGFIPSEWPMHICSAVTSSGYRAEADSPSNGGGTALHVSLVQSAIYSDENATLHVELSGQKPSVTTPVGCASLYRVRQGPSIGTRLEPLFTKVYSSRPSCTAEQIKEDKDRAWPSWRTNRQRTCPIPGGQITADVDMWAAELADTTRIEWRTADSPGSAPVFVTAAVHFDVLDVDTLAPNWGDPVEGIQAGLSIDRTRLSIGERVPLHLRWENVNAAIPLAQGECPPVPTLEIQDSQHNVVQTIPIVPGCLGHGWGPFAIPKGKAQRAFVELAVEPAEAPFSNRYNPFPNYIQVALPEGVYYFVSVWSPGVLDPPDTSPLLPDRSEGRFGKVYATARSLPVRIEVSLAGHH